MSECNLCVTVPQELLRFCHKNATPTNFISKVITGPKNFGVKLFKDSDGKLEHAAYYSDSGDLIKKVFYNGSSVCCIEHYRTEKIFCKEIYENDKLEKKQFFNKNNAVTSEIIYTYNRENNIKSISKHTISDLYRVEYGYDDFNRVDGRILLVNGNIVNKQKYKFDILDRIIEYSDLNQKVKVLKVTPNNELINYTITDIMGNEIVVVNWFDLKGYTHSDITLNNHTISIVDRSYVDNVMLKKPYTTEEDLDLIISRIFDKPSSECVTVRSTTSDCVSEHIENNLEVRVLPISIRKRVLYNRVMNAY